jgi:hypothetical protein
VGRVREGTIEADMRQTPASMANVMGDRRKIVKCAGAA